MAGSNRFDSEKNYNKNNSHKNSDKNNWRRLKKGLTPITDWMLAHANIIMPVILVVCVLLTVVIALNANERAKQAGDAETMAAPADGTEALDNTAAATPVIPDIPLAKNQYPEVNELVNNYYEAIANGDMEVSAAINADLRVESQSNLNWIRIEQMSNYIERYESVDVYTKPGLTEDSYVAYVHSEVCFNDIDVLVPGLQTFYIMRGDDGNYSLRATELPPDIYDYVSAVSLQDDVVDLNNKITVAYNDLMAVDQELVDYIAYMVDKVQEDVGVALAQEVQPEVTADEVNGEPDDAAVDAQTGAPAAAGNNTGDNNSGNEGDGPQASDPQPVVSSVRQARTTDVVNIRSSDSETADRLDRAEVGQEFTVLEQKGNGWSRVKYNDGDAYIKSEFLEIIGEAEGDGTSDLAADAQPAESAAGVETDGTVRARESVKVRSTPGTDGDSLGTVYSGEELELIEKMDSGWTKVKYKNEIGYVKSEYLE